MSKIEIKSISGAVLYSCATTTIREAMESACQSRADLTGAYLYRANLTGANLTWANLSWADLTGATGIATEGEEAATLAACLAAIAAEPEHWQQSTWHGDDYDAAEAPAVGSCGSAHCLAGWAQALLPLGDPRRSLDPQVCGTQLMPRAAAAGWFAGDVHPGLAAAVEAARAKVGGTP